jgi:hypothetical protein
MDPLHAFYTSIPLLFIAFAFSIFMDMVFQRQAATSAARGACFSVSHFCMIMCHSRYSACSVGVDDVGCLVSWVSHC